MNDSAQMDELAEGICSRIEPGKPDTVGQWMNDTFQPTHAAATGRHRYRHVRLSQCTLLVDATPRPGQ